MRLLLHVCCAPDATHVIQVLRKSYIVDAFFYNPNIFPKQEYEKRLTWMRRLSEKWNIVLYEGNYDQENWLLLTEKYKHEPEGGKRCDVCFAVRLEKTAQLAKEKHYDIFCTTLSISPHKNAKSINDIGKEIGAKYGIGFLEANFKKGNGFKKSVELSKELGLYRQDYCGCVYSIKTG
jgi:predicted adenine nucleotide alpha hydrolase (AANH) superfamily ATPase